jgi:hypothetical protein
MAELFLKINLLYQEKLIGDSASAKMVISFPLNRKHYEKTAVDYYQTKGKIKSRFPIKTFPSMKRRARGNLKIAHCQTFPSSS